VLGGQVRGDHLARRTAGPVPRLAVALGGARVGVTHNLLEVAERSAGVEVQGRERVSHRLGTKVADQVVRQASLRGQAAYEPPHVAREQPSAGPSDEQRLPRWPVVLAAAVGAALPAGVGAALTPDVCATLTPDVCATLTPDVCATLTPDASQVGPPGQISVDPHRGRTGERQRPALAVPAGDPQHEVALFGAEVLDIRADDLTDPGAGEQQHGDQRRGTGMPRAARGVGRVQERQRLLRV
jgi:hypothetical protein